MTMKPPRLRKLEILYAPHHAPHATTRTHKASMSSSNPCAPSHPAMRARFPINQARTKIHHDTLGRSALAGRTLTNIASLSPLVVTAPPALEAWGHFVLSALSFGTSRDSSCF